MADANKDAAAPESIQLEATQTQHDIEAKPRTQHVSDPDAVEAAPSKNVLTDKAAQFLKEADHQVVVTRANNRRVLSIIDWRLLPLLW